jgi:Ca-activated chloride channel family protein
VAELTLSYVELPSLTWHTIEVPVHVNVVPGDQAAGRIADPAVTSERVFQEVQQEKRRAGDALRKGDAARAAASYRVAAERLEEFLPAAAPQMRSELASEASLLQDMADRASWDEPARLSKFTEADRAAKTRKRGRRPPEAA